MKNLFYLFTLCLISFSCKSENQANNSSETTRNVHYGKQANGMIVSAREEASRIGIKIMKKGGNAFDAMVATDMALAVCFPFAGNIGGGGFMVYRLESGETGTLDYREKAPMTAYESMYLDEKGEIIPKLSLDGALAIGVPGTVAGMYAAHQRFGKLNWKEVVQPAIDLAEKGFLVTEKQAVLLNLNREKFKQVNKEAILFDKDWKKGDTIKIPKLAATLEKIRDGGRDAFYKGEMAKNIADFIQSNGGIITAKDLEKYEVSWRNPLKFNFKEYQIITMGPPSSGGIVLGQIMKSIEKYPLKSFGHNQPQYIQLITEASRRAYADRAYFLGDPDFVDVPVEELLSNRYLENRMNDFSFQRATPSSEIKHGEIAWTESNETTHYSIVDTYGNAVAVTTTINGAYGSKLYSNDLGFFFNNEMDDFSAKPGKANMFGLVGGSANKIEPEKRMLSSMTPTIITLNGELYMVLGSPGGSTIITTVLQTILNQTVFGMNMQNAVSAKRFHHQWLPDEILLEPNGFDDEVISDLKSKGYHINENNSIILGKMDAILVGSKGELEAGADPRGDDSAVSY